ncbi:FtsX-like permease family protein [Streptomyces sp. NPDC003233]
MLLAPIGVFIAAAVRFGGQHRDRRLAALRLVGADRGMTTGIAAGEAVPSTLVGIALGTILFLAVLAVVAVLTLCLVVTRLAMNRAASSLSESCARPVGPHGSCDGASRYPCSSGSRLPATRSTVVGVRSGPGLPCCPGGPVPPCSLCGSGSSPAHR